MKPRHTDIANLIADWIHDNILVPFLAALTGSTYRG